jgi:L-galactose dehydrogenase
MQYRTLGNTGLSVSQIGFGASPLGDVFGKTNPADGAKAVLTAIDSGINYFDVSPYYGLLLAEERLGRALRGVRQKVILATKCCRYGVADFDFSAARVKSSIDESLRRLQTDYVDLLQAHDIEFGDVNQIVNETIPALRDVQQSGKARHVGISGYPLQMLMSVATLAPVDTILSYCRYNLLVTDLDASLAPFAKRSGIGLINASPLHMGLLSGSPVPDWHPAPATVRQAAAEVLALCRKQDVDAAKVAIGFSAAHPSVSTTLVGISSSEQVHGCIDALQLRASPSLLADVERIVARAKNVIWPSGLEQNMDR